MARYVEFKLEEGGTILVETPDEAEKASAGFGRSGEAGQKLEPARQSLDAALENVRKSAEVLTRKLRGLSAPPDDMEINFSLKASGDQGDLAVARSSSEANFHVSLRWRKEEGESKKGKGKKENPRRERATQAIGKSIQPDKAQVAEEDEGGEDDEE